MRCKGRKHCRWRQYVHDEICTVRIALHEIAYEARLCDKHTNYIHKTIKKILKQQHLWGDNMCSEVRHILSPTTICTCIILFCRRQYVPMDDNMCSEGRYILSLTTICTERQYVPSQTLVLAPNPGKQQHVLSRL